jgi:hypothetical protein
VVDVEVGHIVLKMADDWAALAAAYAANGGAQQQMMEATSPNDEQNPQEVVSEYCQVATEYSADPGYANAQYQVGAEEVPNDQANDAQTAYQQQVMVQQQQYQYQMQMLQMQRMQQIQRLHMQRMMAAAQGQVSVPSEGQMMHGSPQSDQLAGLVGGSGVQGAPSDLHGAGRGQALTVPGF